MKILAIDGDLYLPKLAFHFGICNPMNPVCPSKERGSRLEESIYRDARTGVDVLLRSSKLHDIFDIGQMWFGRIVMDVQTRYDVTLIDSPVGIPFDTISTFRLAEYQLIVIEVERGPIHSFHKMVEKLKALGRPTTLKSAC